MARIIGAIVVLLGFYFCVHATAPEDILQTPAEIIVLGILLGGGLMAVGPRTGSALQAVFAKQAPAAQLQAGIDPELQTGSGI